MRSLLRWLLGAVLVLPVLLVGIIGVVLFTEGAGRWVVSQVVERSQGQIRAGRFSGRLWDSFELEDVAFDTPAASGKLERIKIVWIPQALFDRKVVVDAVEIDGVDLKLSPQPSEPGGPPPDKVAAPPLPIALKRIELKSLAIEASGNRVAIDRLLIGAAWDAEAVRLTGFEIEAYGHRLAANGAINVGESPTLAANANWSGELGGEPGVGSLELSGPLSELRFESAIDAQVSAEVSGRIDPLADVPSLSVSGKLQPPALGGDITLAETHFNVEGTLAALAVSIETDVGTTQTGNYGFAFETDLKLGDPSDDGIVGTFAWRAEPVRPDGATIVGNGKISFSDERVRIDHTTAAPHRTHLAGDVMLGANAPVLDLALDWSDLHYAFGDNGEVVGRDGKLTLSGPVADLKVDFTGEFDVPTLGRAGVDTHARVKNSTLDVHAITARLLDGAITGTASVDWTQALGGEFRLRGEDINLAGIRTDTPSRLGFDSHGNFKSGANGMAATVELARIDGHLRGQTVSGNARAHVNGAEYRLEHARLAAGENKITARGTWSRVLDGELDLVLPDLGVFDSRLNGSINGTGTIAGKASTPKVNSQLSGSGLKFADLEIQSVDLAIDADMASDTESTATLSLSGLEFDGKAYGEVSADLRGTPAAHTLALALDGPVITLQARASGGIDEAAWRGSVDAVELGSSGTGEWSLAAPSPVSLAADSLSLEETCFVSKPGEICIAAAKQGETTQVQARLAAVSLSLSDYYLPGTLKLRGATTGAADLMFAAGVLTGQGAVRVTDGFVERRTGGNDSEQIAIETFTVEFEVLPKSIVANIDAAVARWLSINSKINAGRAEATPIDATFDLRSDDISWLVEFAPAFAGTRGGFEMSGSVSGSVEAPSAEGRLRLIDGVIEVPDIGLVVDRIESEFNGSLSSLYFTAGIGAGAGTLDIGGSAARHDVADWTYDATIDGKDFPLVRIPEAEADISPALALKGSAKALHLSGTLLVPRVQIDAQRLPPSAVSVSEDEIVVSADGTVPEEPARSSFMTEQVSGDVAIRFGDDISINGFGLTSRLSGGVDWRKQHGSALGTATGVVRIDKGVFRAYGQHMQIDDGRISFAGPVDNPNLNLRAFRPGLPVKAGVDVTGSIREPNISLFSEPPQSDGNTLSYIVTGRALDDASAGDAALLTQAALSLGAEESAVVTNQIRSTFGLDELSVSAGDTVQDTSLVAGKRLSPKLSVRTDFNPFDQLWTFFLNYKLTPRWSVEAESGERQGADLLYSIERERLFEGFEIFD